MTDAARSDGRRSSEKRKFHGTDSGDPRPKRPSSGRPSSTFDEFGLNDFESQDLIEAVEIVESNPNSPAKLMKWMPSSECSRSTQRIVLDAGEVARRLDFGSQRGTTRRLSKERRKQATVDNYFTTSKPGLIQAHIESTKKLGHSKDDSPRNAPRGTTQLKGLRVEQQSSNDKLASDVNPIMNHQISLPSPNPRTGTSKSAEVRDLMSEKRTQVPLKSHASRRSSLFRKSFGELSNGSAETSFDSIFSQGRSFNAAAPGQSPMTSFAESTPGSQGAQMGYGPTGMQTAREVLRGFVNLTNTGLPVLPVKQSAQNYRLRDLPTKGLFGELLSDPYFPTIDIDQLLLYRQIWLRLHHRCDMSVLDFLNGSA